MNEATALHTQHWFEWLIVSDFQHYLQEHNRFASPLNSITLDLVQVAIAILSRCTSYAPPMHFYALPLSVSGFLSLSLIKSFFSSALRHCRSSRSRRQENANNARRERESLKHAANVLVVLFSLPPVSERRHAIEHQPAVFAVVPQVGCLLRMKGLKLVLLLLVVSISRASSLALSLKGIAIVDGLVRIVTDVVWSLKPFFWRCFRSFRTFGVCVFSLKLHLTQRIYRVKQRRTY